MSKRRFKTVKAVEMSKVAVFEGISMWKRNNMQVAFGDLSHSLVPVANCIRVHDLVQKGRASRSDFINKRLGNWLVNSGRSVPFLQGVTKKGSHSTYMKISEKVALNQNFH